ncbi:MAG: alpha/beta hydrolase [Culicoidibacterales bacterium]
MTKKSTTQKRSNKALAITGVTTAALTFGAIGLISKKLQKTLLYPQQAELLPLPPHLAAEVSLDFDEKIINAELITIAAHDGYSLEAAYLPAATLSNKYVVLVHGITQNLRASLKLYPLFHRLGYNVITYSQRNHGGNADTYTTFGVREKYDLQAVVSYLYDRFGSEIVVGVHGISMGAATVLQYAAIAGDKIAFAISDCAYSTAIEEFNYRLKVEYPLLAWFPFTQSTRLLTLLTHRFDLATASPLKTIRHVETPILFIHGLADTYILPDMSLHLYEAKTLGNKALWFVPDAGHDNCLETDYEGYQTTVSKFLATYL